MIKKNDRKQQWRESNRERDRKNHRLYMKKWRVANWERCRQYERRWRKNNKDRFEASMVAWRKKTLPRIRECKRVLSKGWRGRLADDYVAKLLGMSLTIVPQAIIEAKRAQLMMLRELRRKS